MMLLGDKLGCLKGDWMLKVLVGSCFLSGRGKALDLAVEGKGEG